MDMTPAKTDYAYDCVMTECDERQFIGLILLYVGLVQVSWLADRGWDDNVGDRKKAEQSWQRSGKPCCFSGIFTAIMGGILRQYVAGFDELLGVLMEFGLGWNARLPYGIMLFIHWAYCTPS
jgi:hypothetical protein